MPNRREFFGQLAGASIAAVAANAACAPKAATVVGSPIRRVRGVVQTVRGPIDASKLGVTLPHEHLFAASAGVLQTWPELLGGRAALSEKVLNRLAALKE